MFTVNGHPTTMTFSKGNSGLALYFDYDAITPFGVDGGEPIDDTRMSNVTYRTAVLRHLVSLSSLTLRGIYDPELLASIIAQVNVNQLLTITFPDGKKWKVWGGIVKFTPGELTADGKGTCTVDIRATNRNDSGVETGPAFEAA